MILLTGLRATGKTTVCKILQEEDYWYFDTGPFWRSFRDKVAPDMNVGELHFKMRDYFKDERWEDNFLATILEGMYKDEMHTKKDLIISGYRNVEEALHLTKQIENKVFPERKTSIWYVHAPVEVAFSRYKEREGDHVKIEDLIAHHENERQRGAENFKEIADVIIDNSVGEESLRETLFTVSREHLGMPQTSIEGNMLRGGKERR